MEENNSYQNHPYHDNSYEGSYGAGIALGFLAGLIGLIIGLVINQPLTKKGCVHGFVARLIIGTIFLIIYFVALAELIDGWHY